jgi:hypothetical protein
MPRAAKPIAAVPATLAKAPNMVPKRMSTVARMV